MYIKLTYFFKLFLARRASSVYLDDMSLVGPTGVLVLVLMLSGTQGSETADGKRFSEFEMRLEGGSP